MTQPIKPEEVKATTAHIPDYVIKSFNELIGENWNGSSAKFTQDEVIERVVSKHDISSDEIFMKGYLNVEPAYRELGWKVFYDKPTYCETYKATFKFSK
tara:strand:- start:4 stop:300 length:297 start_codon:yes stop_codon:yes gene_type:complete